MLTTILETNLLKAWPIDHLTTVFEMPWVAINASKKSMVLVVEQSLFIANTHTHLESESTNAK